MQQRKIYTPEQMKSLWKELVDIPHFRDIEREKIAAAEKSLLNQRPQLKDYTDEVFTPEFDHLTVLNMRLRQLQHPGRIKQLEIDIKEPQSVLAAQQPVLAAEKSKRAEIKTRITQLETAVRLYDNRIEAARLQGVTGSLRDRVAIHARDIVGLSHDIDELNAQHAQSEASLTALNLALGQMRAERAKLEREQRERERLAREAAERAEHERLLQEEALRAQQQGGVGSSQQSGGMSSSVASSGGMSSSMSSSAQGGVTSSSMQNGGMHSSMQNNVGGTVSSQQTVVVSYPDETPLLTQIEVVKSGLRNLDDQMREKQRLKSQLMVAHSAAEDELAKQCGVLSQLQKSNKTDADNLSAVSVPVQRADMIAELVAKRAACKVSDTTVDKLQKSVDSNQKRVDAINANLDMLHDELTGAERVIREIEAKYPSVDLSALPTEAEVTLTMQKGSIVRSVAKEVNLQLLLEWQRSQDVRVNEVRAEKDKRARAVRTSEASIRTAQDEIQTLDRRERMLNDDDFLIKFRDEPQGLVTALYNRARIMLEGFAQRNDLHAQPPFVRAWLTTLLAKMNFVLSLQYRNKTEIERAQILYVELSGLIQRAIQQTERVRDKSFSNQLDGLLSQNIIEKNYALKKYEEMRDRHADELKELTEDDVAHIDLMNFDNALAELRKRLATLPVDANSVLRKYYGDVDALLKNTEQRFTVARNKQQHFDLVLNTNIITAAGELLFHPENGNVRNKLIIWGGNIKDGEQSLWKKVLGIVGAIIGGALLIAGGLGLQGILPGVSLPASIPMIAGGATLFAGGIALAVNGRRKGFCKTLDKVDEHAAQVVNDGVAARSLQQIGAVYDQNQHAFFQQPSAPVWDELPEDARPSAPMMGL